MTFGEKLKNLRKQKQMSIKELAKLSKLSATQISSYEHNHVVPNAINHNKLAIALQCDFDDLKSD